MVEQVYSSSVEAIVEDFNALFANERSGYLCGLSLMNREFFGALLVGSNASTSVKVLSVRDVVCRSVSLCTLGGVLFSTVSEVLEVVGDEGSGCSGEREVTLPNCVDSSSKALRTGSPACREGYVVDGGAVSI